MSYDQLSNLPDQARLWIYAADHALTGEERSALDDALTTFFASWKSHGRPVQGAYDIVAGRFLLVGAIVEDADISGCGIDASVNVIEQAARDLDVEWLSPLYVFYRTPEGSVRAVSRSGFRQLVERGEITTQTPVFDVSVDTVGALRDGAFEKPASTSWHAQAFALPEPTSS